ncbi:Hypothetical_protein [Hexamita inflata]|uniref:Hypothetical_protein n=1 Tax=Hexamita inflata TaxID=28002 RepID=A0AA86TJC4_9EUKA|nr:Hypothetical protein HINF_LOCUS6855 [Hexamita inflata]
MFTVTQNENYLVMKWKTKKQPKQQHDTVSQEIKNKYDEIHVIGLQNAYTEFSNYDLLMKSDKFFFTYCQLDLSKIKGKYEQLFFDHCQFSNICESCQTNILTVQRTVLTSNQLVLFCPRVQINVTVDRKYQFEISSVLEDIKCDVIYMTISDHLIDLNLLIGSYYDFKLSNCEIIGLSNSKFKTKYLHLNECKINTESIESILCQQLQIMQTSPTTDYNYVLPLCSQAQYQQLFLTGYTLDIQRAQSTHFITCSKCNIQQQFEQLLDSINRNKIKLSHCKVDLCQLNGYWQHIDLNNCELFNSPLKNSITADKIVLAQSNLTDYSPFKSQISKIQYSVLKILPNSKMISLTQCSLDLILNSNVEILYLNDVKLKNFSVLKLPELKCINFYNDLNENQTQTLKQIRKYNLFMKTNKHKFYQSRVMLQDRNVRNQILKDKVQDLQKVRIALEQKLTSWESCLE